MVHYTEAATLRKLATAAILKLEQSKIRTPIGKHDSDANGKLGGKV